MRRAPASDSYGNNEADLFLMTLEKNQISLTRADIDTLQVNVGLVCNQRCSHCHLDAGPHRSELMTGQVLEEVIRLAKTPGIRRVDITGGAPELHPELPALLKSISETKKDMIFRANLTALSSGYEETASLLASLRVAIYASFPSIDKTQAESVRGKNSFAKSLDTLRLLNDLGYGMPGSDLVLNLVSNPSGAFLPPPQKELERRFKRILEDRYHIFFNNLYSFANVPLGRFKDWLLASGNYERYMERLRSSFNPEAAKGVMCRSLVSVSWDGYLFDCDFNLAAGLFAGNRKIHISECTGLPEKGSPIATGPHCFTCTAGSGFT